MWKRIIVDRKYIEYVDKQVDDIFEPRSNSDHKNHKLGFRDSFFIPKEKMIFLGVYPTEYKIYKDVTILILVSSSSRTFNLIYKVNKRTRQNYEMPKY